MMISPRSFMLSSTRQRTPSSPECRDEKAAMIRARQSAEYAHAGKRKEDVRPVVADRVKSSPASVQSKPVVIPSRNASRQGNGAQTVRARGSKGGRTTPLPANHKADAMSPSVAALLAVTAIPPPRRNSTSPRRRTTTGDRRISIDELIQEWKEEDKDITPTGSPMDILMEGPDENDVDDGSSIGSSGREDKDAMSSTRSVSSESIPSIPSLEADERSVLSLSGASTPRSWNTKPAVERKERFVSSPPREDVVLDHPLLHFDSDHPHEVPQDTVAEFVTVPRNTTKVFSSSLKSNLTAGLQALKSAVNAFSNFTAPSVPPDDLLTRSLFTPRFSSEMRPKPLPGLPSPELRRYLNPNHPSPLSAAELPSHLHDTLSLASDPDTDVPMIQMQTYDRRSKSPSRRRRTTTQDQPSALDPLSEAGRALSPSPAIRQREPRENSDFLRVIVLEMNMRREGKLDAKAVGKARIWLPPRKAGIVGGDDEEAGQVSTRKVPRRWVGVHVDEL